MAFTVSGTIDGRELSVTLDAGDLDGDPAAIERIEELIVAGETVFATPTGPAFTAALEPEGVGLVTLVSVFAGDREILVWGDVPDVPGSEIPPDATA